MTPGKRARQWNADDVAKQFQPRGGANPTVITGNSNRDTLQFQPRARSEPITASEHKCLLRKGQQVQIQPSAAAPLRSTEKYLEGFIEGERAPARDETGEIPAEAAGSTPAVPSFAAEAGWTPVRAVLRLAEVEHLIQRNDRGEWLPPQPGDWLDVVRHFERVPAAAESPSRTAARTRRLAAVLSPAPDHRTWAILVLLTAAGVHRALFQPQRLRLASELARRESTERVATAIVRALEEYQPGDSGAYLAEVLSRDLGPLIWSEPKNRGATSALVQIGIATQQDQELRQRVAELVEFVAVHRSVDLALTEDQDSVRARDALDRLRRTLDLILQQQPLVRHQLRGKAAEMLLEHFGNQLDRDLDGALDELWVSRDSTMGTFLKEVVRASA